MATTEIIIEISVAPDQTDGMGIANDAEKVVNECFYLTTHAASDAFGGAADALREAAEKCERRANQQAQAEYDALPQKEQLPL